MSVDSLLKNKITNPAPAASRVSSLLVIFVENVLFSEKFKKMTATVNTRIDIGMENNEWKYAILSSDAFFRLVEAYLIFNMAAINTEHIAKSKLSM
jgi:hypothetical protein